MDYNDARRVKIMDYNDAIFWHTAQHKREGQCRYPELCPMAVLISEVEKSQAEVKLLHPLTATVERLECENKELWKNWDAQATRDALEIVSLKAKIEQLESAVLQR